MLLALLLGCPSPESTDTTDTAGTDTADTDTASTETGDDCNWSDPTQTVLAYDEACSSGVSAEDLLAFAIGSFARPLSWDDATSTTVTITTAPGAATESNYGDPAVCMGPSLGLDVTATVVTDDTRLALSLPSNWFVEDATPDAGDLGSVTVDTSVDPTDAGVSASDPASRFSLRILFRTSGEVTMSLRETWELDADTTRTCTRAGTEGVSLDCNDIDDTTAPE